MGLWKVCSGAFRFQDLESDWWARQPVGWVSSTMMPAICLVDNALFLWNKTRPTPARLKRLKGMNYLKPGSRSRARVLDEGLTFENRSMENVPDVLYPFLCLRVCVCVWNFSFCSDKLFFGFFYEGILIALVFWSSEIRYCFKNFYSNLFVCFRLRFIICDLFVDSVVCWGLMKKYCIVLSFVRNESFVSYFFGYQTFLRSDRMLFHVTIFRCQQFSLY